MLVIRLQRTGRKGHAQFRVVVQDSRRTPSSGKVVAWLGNYDPHAKVLNIDKEKASFYLNHGAHPSNRLVSLLDKEGLKLPQWVKKAKTKSGTTKNADKRRSTRPQEVAPVETEVKDNNGDQTKALEAETTEDVKPAEVAQQETA